MPIKDILERLIDYIAFFFLFDGIITGVFTLLNILFTGFSNIFGQYTNLFGYYPSSTYILILNIVVAISSILVGIGLMSRSHIARIGAIVLSIFYLIDIPFGTVTGSIITGNPINSYIIGGELLKQNVSFFAVTIFITAWVTVGVVQLPAEIDFLGKKFAVLRNLTSLLLAIAVSALIVITWNIF